MSRAAFGAACLALDIVKAEAIMGWIECLIPQSVYHVSEHVFTMSPNHTLRERVAGGRVRVAIRRERHRCSFTFQVYTNFETALWQ